MRKPDTNNIDEIYREFQFSLGQVVCEDKREELADILDVFWDVLVALNDEKDYFKAEIESLERNKAVLEGNFDNFYDDLRRVLLQYKT